MGRQVMEVKGTNLFKSFKSLELTELPKRIAGTQERKSREKVSTGAAARTQYRDGPGLEGNGGTGTLFRGAALRDRFSNVA